MRRRKQERRGKCEKEQATSRRERGKKGIIRRTCLSSESGGASLALSLVLGFTWKEKVAMQSPGSCPALSPVVAWIFSLPCHSPAPLGSPPARRCSWVPSRGWGPNRNHAKLEHGQAGVGKADAAPLLLP